MISEALQKAREFEAAYMPYVQEDERPVFHVTGSIGWINDPNGFSPYKGEYHLFFQNHPYSNQWGPMHWGHVKTRDFIRWERLPIAIAPDTEADKDGCFSGGAIELADGRQMLVYTGVVRKRRDDGVMEEFQHQCVAFGDGVDYEKYPGNPVISDHDLPAGCSILDFRDPKVWREDGLFHLVVGNRSADGSGAILLFDSENGTDWRFSSVLDQCRNEYGKMWECPDFFPLGDKRVLLTSSQEMSAMGLEFHAGYGSLALIGEYDPAERKFTREKVHAVDYGIDFYAPQTLETYDGRRVMIAWMQNWTTSNCKPLGCRIFGQMTLPRELELRGGRLVQNPVRELERYHGRRVLFSDMLVSEEIFLPGVKGRLIDMTVSIRPVSEGASYECFRVHVAKDGEHVTTIRYKLASSTIRVDRTHSGFPYDIVHVRDFAVRPQGGAVKLRLVMDKNSLELFVNDGEQAASFMLYTPVTADVISFETVGGSVMMDVEKYDLTF